jgi:hypothetical protein
MDSSELLEQQRARLLAIVDVELGRIYTSVQLGPMDAEQRKSLECVARLLRDLEKTDARTDKPPEKLSATAIGEALQGHSR